MLGVHDYVPRPHQISSSSSSSPPKANYCFSCKNGIISILVRTCGQLHRHAIHIMHALSAPKVEVPCIVQSGNILIIMAAHYLLLMAYWWLLHCRMLVSKSSTPQMILRWVLRGEVAERSFISRHSHSTQDKGLEKVSISVVDSLCPW